MIHVLQITFVFLHNLFLFIPAAVRHGVPLHLWPTAWRKIQRSHEMEIGRELTRRVMAGKVKRRLVNGEFRYYPMDYDV